MKEIFLRYEQARQSGKYNMIMDARQVMKDYDISEDEYIQIIKNYDNLKKIYG